MDYSTGQLRWSETIEAQYGLLPGGFSGRFDDFVALVHPDDRESLAETLRTAMRFGADFTTLHRVLLPDGAVRWLSGTGRIQLDEKSEPLRGIGISLDVTDRHLTEERSQQAQKMEAVGRLASGVAHDFNNLLTVILGFADFMTEDVPAASPHGKDLAEIIKAARRARSITRQLLAFSRQQVLQPTAIDVGDLIAEMSGMFEPLLGENIVVSLAPGSSVPPARADRPSSSSGTRSSASFDNASSFRKSVSTCSFRGGTRVFPFITEPQSILTTPRACISWLATSCGLPSTFPD
jgi:PAS domain S-box-containing protein